MVVQGGFLIIEFLRVFIYDFNYLSQLGNIMKIEKYGLPENYKTWHERIIDYFKENPKKWRTQKQIREGLNIKWVRPDQPDYYRFYDLNTRLRELLKGGFLIRAYAPEFLKVKARTIKMGS